MVGPFCAPVRDLDQARAIFPGRANRSVPDLASCDRSAPLGIRAIWRSPALQSTERRRNIFSLQSPAALNQRQPVAIGQRREKGRIEFPSFKLREKDE